MKFLTLLLVAGLIAVFSPVASAQLCGSFGVTLNVYDNELKPVTGHTVKIVPWLKDELSGKTFEAVEDKPGASEIKLLEGHVIIGNYKVIVSAPGFLDTEKSINFPHCVRVSYDILLLKKKEKRAVVSGHLTDEEGRSVPYIGVTFTSYADKTARSVSTDFMGNYELKLKPGDYRITFLKGSYLPLKTQKFTVPPDGSAVFNLLLRSKTSYSLKGAVVDEGGAPIPDTKITFKQDNGQTYVAYSDPDGLYQMKIPAGTYSVEAQYTKHQAWKVFKLAKYSVRPTKSGPLNITLKTDPEFTRIHGREIPGEMPRQPDLLI